MLVIARTLYFMNSFLCQCDIIIFNRFNRIEIIYKTRFILNGNYFHRYDSLQLVLLGFVEETLN